MNEYLQRDRLIESGYCLSCLFYHMYATADTFQVSVEALSRCMCPYSEF